MSKKTVFNSEWLKDPKFSGWVKRCAFDRHKAMCVLCDRSFELGNMGRKALQSHANGVKHKVLESTRGKIQSEHEPISHHWARVTEGCTESSTLSGGMEYAASSSDQCPSSLSVPQSEKKTIDSFLAKDATLEAEILWAITTVMEHYSANSCENTNHLFPRMFPDSKIAQKFSCGKTKCGYLIKFGLAPYFHKQVVSAVSQPEILYSVSFDESFNKPIQEEQKLFDA